MTKSNSLIVLMGVAGCGKSSVGAALAIAIGATYIDGDDLHPASNIEKMSRGEALSDNDRWPWLAKVGDTLGSTEGSIIIGCSALKRTYREAISAAADASVLFVHLSGTRKVIEARMSSRPGHFMPVSLLDSQFSTLEQLAEDENGLVVDIDQPLEKVVAEIVAGLV